MENFLDTAMTVGVADTLYKITPVGTFFTTIGTVDDLEKAASAFDKATATEIGDYCYKVNDVVYLYDTFGKVSGDTIEYEQVDDAEGSIETRASSTVYKLGQTDEENAQTYGLSTYRWRTNSWGMVRTFFGVFGTDCTKTNNFDKKHRVECRLYKVNYKFIKSCGFNVKMQRRKKFVFVPYWISCSAENLVIGIEEFHGRTTLKMDFKQSPLYIEDRGHYVDSAFGYVNNMLYTGYLSCPVLSEWLDNKPINTVYACLKSFDVLDRFKEEPWTYTDKLQKQAIYSGLKYLENKAGG